VPSIATRAFVAEPRQTADLDRPLMVAVVGRPGTGKTTLARMLAIELRAAHLRLDAIQAAVVRSDVAQTSYGLVGYLVAQAVAAGCLAVGTPVVVDSVSAVPNARRGWTRVAEQAGATLRVIELGLSDPVEHRHRVKSRVSDLPGVAVPSWEVVMAGVYAPWDDDRDGPRLVVDNLLSEDVMLAAALEYVLSGDHAHSLEDLKWKPSQTPVACQAATKGG
jgi:predicted kinase